jgi:hypothetical protein
MGMNYGNVTKSSFQADIKRKQAFYSRCKRRFKVAQTPIERKWLKSEATRVCTELKLCCKKWKTFGFGGFTWITKNYTVTNFTSALVGMKTKTIGHKSPGRSSTKRTTSRPKVRTSNRTRSSAARRSYSAW